jgi:hypothetical protein
LIYLVLKWETCIILTNVCPWDVRYLVLLWTFSYIFAMQLIVYRHSNAI